MGKLFKLLFWTAGIVIFFAVVGRLLLYDVWTLPAGGWISASAAPTLAGGDTVLVLTRGEPTFGDLVRCADPERPGFVVGRIVGVGGDFVEVRGRTLLVNNTRYNADEACVEPFVTIPHPDTGNPTEIRCSRVDIGGGWHFRGTSNTYSPSNDDSHRVGPGKVYLLSDNRDMHDDTRDFGTVPLDSCEGPIFLRLWGPKGWTSSHHRLDPIR